MTRRVIGDRRHDADRRCAIALEGDGGGLDRRIGFDEDRRSRGGEHGDDSNVDAAENGRAGSRVDQEADALWQLPTSAVVSPALRARGSTATIAADRCVG